MIMEGCQGNKGNQLQEKICPNCGNLVEVASWDVFATCEACGFVVYNDRMDCVLHCQQARECIGEELYEKLMAAQRELGEALSQDDDEW